MPRATRDSSQTDAAVAATAPPLAFEAAMHELETLVEKLEQGEFTLEESLRQYARGIELTRACEQALHKAEQQVLALTGSGEGEALRDFTLTDDPES